MSWCKKPQDNQSKPVTRLFHPEKSEMATGKSPLVVKQVEESIPLFEAAHNPNKYQLKREIATNSLFGDIYFSTPRCTYSRIRCIKLV